VKDLRLSPKTTNRGQAASAKGAAGRKKRARRTKNEMESAADDRDERSAKRTGYERVQRSMKPVHPTDMRSGPKEVCNERGRGNTARPVQREGTREWAAGEMGNGRHPGIDGRTNGGTAGGAYSQEKGRKRRPTQTGREQDRRWHQVKEPQLRASEVQRGELRENRGRRLKPSQRPPSSNVQTESGER